ncbi:MAG: DoxX family protein [Bacteroidia bacterium]|nr:DoxX family protein [Bacteroidia bacterium]
MTSTHHLGLLVLRISASGLILVHGIPKLLEVLQGDFGFGDPIGVGATLTKILAIIGEVICPLLIIIGFKTRLAAIPAMITMFVAAFIVHADDPFANKEKALLFGFAFLVIALVGAGKFSVDKK